MVWMHCLAQWKQAGKDSTLNEWYQNTMNVASMELQGCIKTAEGKYAEAIRLLEKAQKSGIALGYREPPAYPRPVVITWQLPMKNPGSRQKQVEVYESVLKRFPNSGIGLAGLVRLYAKTGNAAKAKERKAMLQDVGRFGDEGVLWGLDEGGDGQFGSGWIGIVINFYCGQFGSGWFGIVIDCHWWSFWFGIGLRGLLVDFDVIGPFLCRYLHP